MIKSNFLLLIFCFFAVTQSIGEENKTSSLKIDADNFIFSAVFEGLQEDGVAFELVDKILGNKSEHFVGKCPICEPTKAAFSLYLNKKFKFGKGLDPTVMETFNSESSKAKQHKLLRDLITGYISKKFKRVRLNESQKQQLKNRLQAMRKEGMERISSRVGDFCPSCDGVNQISKAKKLIVINVKDRSLSREYCSKFLSTAVLEGLQNYGIKKDLAKKIIEKQKEYFVGKCDICRNVKSGFRQYLKSEMTFGNGLTPLELIGFHSKDKTTKQQALEQLIKLFIHDKLEGIAVTQNERRQLKKQLISWRKRGMSVKPKRFGDFCPSCEGVTSPFSDFQMEK